MSRDEMKEWTMAEKFRQFDPQVKIDYVSGDVRDKERVHRAMDGIDAAIDQRVEMIVAPIIFGNRCK